MFDILGKLNEAKQKAEEIKQRLERVEFSSQQGFANVSVNGNKRVTRIDISITDFSETAKKQVEDDILSAINTAMESAGRSAEAEMAVVTKGLIPGM